MVWNIYINRAICDGSARGHARGREGVVGETVGFPTHRSTPRKKEGVVGETMGFPTNRLLFCYYGMVVIKNITKDNTKDNTKDTVYKQTLYK
jgi:hypothetical protein